MQKSYENEINVIGENKANISSENIAFTIFSEENLNRMSLIRNSKESEKANNIEIVESSSTPFHLNDSDFEKLCKNIILTNTFFF